MNHQRFIDLDWPDIALFPPFNIPEACWAEWSSIITDNDAQEKRLSFFYEQEKGSKLLSIIFSSSPYLSTLILAHPDWLEEVLFSPIEDVLSSIPQSLIELRDQMPAHDTMMQTMRDLKSKLALTLALGDLSGVLTFEQITESLSIFAEQAIETALYYACHHLGGKKLNPEESPMSIIGLGKLGGFELNYSSDIDIIIFYHHHKAEEVFSDRSTDKIPNLMKNIALHLQTILSKITAQGYVFRTDLRLRPDPASTSPAVEMNSAFIYYESRARNWERASFIKARPVAGNISLGKEFLSHLAPFIWRNHLDYAGLQDICDIKHQITQAYETASADLAGYNLKLGRGGIRSIEFYIQMLQMIWGGKRQELRKKSSLKALKALKDADLICDQTAQILEESYRFLRRSEHRLQMVEDRQTHSLPNEKTERDSFIRFMGYQHHSDFLAKLRGIFDQVEAYHQNLFTSEPQSDNKENNIALSLFNNEEHQDAAINALKAHNFEHPKDATRLISQWQMGKFRALQTERARHLLGHIFPRLILCFSKTTAPDQALKTFDHFLSSLPAGIQWLSLFKAHPHLLDSLSAIMGNSPFIADQLRHFPYLIETLLEQSPKEQDFKTLFEEFQTRFHYSRYFEKQLDSARDWNREKRFISHCHLLSGAIEAIPASRTSSAIAQSLLIMLLEAVQEDFRRQYGDIKGGKFVILGLGRLGSYQILPKSDLDLICLYEHDEDCNVSNGKTPLAIETYYQRLTQRLITALTTQTSRGGLYQIDLRLRPFGTAGPLALRREGFLHYYHKDARLWEFLALTRARPVAGSRDLIRLMVKDIRGLIASAKTLFPEVEMKKETASMRKRIAEKNQSKNFWDIKHSRGGIVDLEFILQYLQLRHPEIRPSPDFSLVLKRLKKHHILKVSQTDILEKAHILWHSLQSILQLTEEKNANTLSFPENQKYILTMVCGRDSFDQAENDVKDLRRKVKKIYDDVIATP